MYNFNNNNNGNRGFFPQYGNPMNANTLPCYDIIQVNGRNGAEAFQMGPNSKVLLLDSSDPIVWLVQTDGAGYKTITPYDITPRQVAPQIDLSTLEARINALEEKVNAKSYSGANKQKRTANTTPNDAE